MDGLYKVISGGQAGVERAALDSAIHSRIYSWGGWVPRGRLAEDGELSDIYFDCQRFNCGLKEHSESRNYKSRTLKNISESDATLILRRHLPGQVLDPGIKLTIKSLQLSKRPYRIFDPSIVRNVPKVVAWICEAKIGDDLDRSIEILNISGSKESGSNGIYESSFQFLNDVLGYVFQYQKFGIKMWMPL